MKQASDIFLPKLLNLAATKIYVTTFWEKSGRIELKYDILPAHGTSDILHNLPLPLLLSLTMTFCLKIFYNIVGDIFYS